MGKTNVINTFDKKKPERNCQYQLKITQIFNLMKIGWLQSRSLLACLTVTRNSLGWNLFSSIIISFYFRSSAGPQIPWRGQFQLPLSVSEHNCSIRFLEHVQVQFDLSFPRRGYLRMSSVSPSRTQSTLFYPRAFDSLTGEKRFSNWTVTSLHYWGENPIGNWTITIRNTKPRRNNRNGNILCSLFLLLQES